MQLLHPPIAPWLVRTASGCCRVQLLKRSRRARRRVSARDAPQRRSADPDAAHRPLRRARVPAGRPALGRRQRQHPLRVQGAARPAPNLAGRRRHAPASAGREHAVPRQPPHTAGLGARPGFLPGVPRSFRPRRTVARPPRRAGVRHPHAAGAATGLGRAAGPITSAEHLLRRRSRRHRAPARPRTTRAS
jgi:hypothetical protein